MSPGCAIQLAFFWVFLPCFCMLILSLPLLGLGSKSTSLNLGSVYIGQSSTIRFVGIGSHFWILCFFPG